MNRVILQTARRSFSIASHANKMKLPFRIPELKLTLDIVKFSDIKDVAMFMAKSFCRDEPRSKCIGATPEDFFPLAMDSLKKSINPSLSAIFKRDSGEIVSALVVDHFPFLDKYFDPKTNPYHPKYEVHLTLTNKTKCFFRDYYFKNNFTGKVARIALGATDDEFRGKFLALYELYAVASRGLEFGFKHVIGDCTNVFSRKNALDSGMKPILKVDYETFTVNGDYPYRNLNKLMTDHVNNRIGMRKFKDLAKECSLMYSPMESMLKVTREILKLD